MAIVDDKSLTFHGVLRSFVLALYAWHKNKNLSNLILLSLQLYIDKNHAISGDKTTRHMRKTMANFLIDSCWGGGEPRVPAEDSSNTS